MSHPSLDTTQEHARVIRICVTGPECTGKTTLAQRLAADFSAELVPEAARIYAERINRELREDDVERIAAEHITMADDASRRVIDRGGGTLILDTDLVSTVVYGQDYYRFASDWLTTEARRRHAQLYLLCDVDVPWVSDGIRDRPTDRVSMRNLFAHALAEFDLPVVRICGSWDARWLLASAACRAVLDDHADR
jgi:NadR type nicotinamide-nucleotide adenylyltransferase